MHVLFEKVKPTGKRKAQTVLSNLGLLSGVQLHDPLAGVAKQNVGYRNPHEKNTLAQLYAFPLVGS